VAGPPLPSSSRCAARRSGDARKSVRGGVFVAASARDVIRFAPEKAPGGCVCRARQPGWLRRPRRRAAFELDARSNAACRRPGLRNGRGRRRAFTAGMRVQRTSRRRKRQPAVGIRTVPGIRARRLVRDPGHGGPHRTDAVALSGGDGETTWRVVVRPSGTEPKIKSYIEVRCADSSDLTDARARAQRLQDELVGAAARV